MKYRKKPVEIDAVQLLPNKQSVIEVYEFIHGEGSIILNCQTDRNKFDDYVDMVSQSGMDIKTLEGIIHASINDFVIKGVKGEFYPCKPDIFEMTYELINN